MNPATRKTQNTRASLRKEAICDEDPNCQNEDNKVLKISLAFNTYSFFSLALLQYASSTTATGQKQLQPSQKTTKQGLLYFSKISFQMLIFYVFSLQTPKNSR